MKPLISPELIAIWQRRRYPTYIFLILSCNLIVAPAVYGATATALDKSQAYALGLLGLVTIALAVYLFVVMFQPERF